MIRVDHAHAQAAMVAAGRDVEAQVLSRAVRWHAERGCCSTGTARSSSAEPRARGVPRRTSARGRGRRTTGHSGSTLAPDLARADTCLRRSARDHASRRESRRLLHHLALLRHARYGCAMSNAERRRPLPGEQQRPVQSVDRALTHPRAAGALRRGRRHRDRRRPRRPQVHGVPAASPPWRRTGWSSRSTTAASTASASGILRLAGATTARLDLVAGGATGLPPARRRHRRDRQHHGAVRHLGALPRPGRRLLGPAAAQLGRPAHPAARDQQRQGAAQRADGAELEERSGSSRPSPTQTITTRARLRDELARSASRGTPSRSTSSRSA